MKYKILFFLFYLSAATITLSGCFKERDADNEEDEYVDTDKKNNTEHTEHNTKPSLPNKKWRINFLRKKIM